MKISGTSMLVKAADEIYQFFSFLLTYSHICLSSYLFYRRSLESAVFEVR